MYRSLVSLIAACLFGLLAVACSSADDAVKCRLAQRLDSLNDHAYRWRYRDIDTVRTCAGQVLREAHRLGLCDAEAEALNTLMFERFQQMDFDSALVLAERVRHLTSNQIELLIADVMSMKIAQRVSDNRAFFTHRVHAARRMERISEEEGLLNPRQLQRFNYARGEFYIVSATYFYYVDQHERALAEIDLAEPYCQLQADTAQWLYFCYMKGSGQMVAAATPELVTRQEFDYLFKCYTFSKNNGYRFFQANALQSLATMLNDSTEAAVVQAYKPDAMEYLAGQFPPGQMPERMAMKAYELFYAYKDAFQSACALRTLGELSFYNADPMQAISYYKQALLLVEGKRLPEWVSGFHQHMSLAYSALDNRKASAAHRNAYLDQLAVTQQDMEQASHYDELQAENRRLSWAFISLIVLSVAIGLLMAYLRRRLKRRARAQDWLLRQVLLLTQPGAADADGTSVAPTARLFHAHARKAQAEGAAERRALEALAEPYRVFMTTANQQMQNLTDEREQLEEQQAAVRMRIVANKRQNVEKRAKLQLVYAIVPFLDRIIGQVQRMERTGVVKPEGLQYICELIDQINDYNDILTQWIQMQRGQLSLRITSFPLRQLFDLLRQGHYAFDQKGVQLCVEDTDAVIKADRSLTLFMLNTLADNARKFTSAGGTVTVSAETGVMPEGPYVEISVKDTGCGLSPEAVETIQNSKVFDASSLPSVPADAAAGKGFGFGLMNCKGIIEKYRKTGAFFAVCHMGVESRVGQGSRFFFRLPRVLTLLLLLLIGGPAFRQSGAHAQSADAYRLMDSVYFANVGGQHDRALAYADSVIAHINGAYAQLGGASASRLVAFHADDASVPADYQWFQRGDSIDFSLLLGLRNELAVAALGLHNWPLYRYNNRIYTHLYKLYNQDTTIESDCQKLERVQSNRRIAIAIILVLLVTGIISSYFLYFRPRLLFRLDISQLLRLNRHLLDLATHSDATPDVLSDQLLSEAQTGINGIHYVRSVALNPDGSLHFDYGGEQPTAGQRTLDQLLSRYVYLILHERVTRQNHFATDLELAEDEQRRSLYEEGQLHVQNQIMDNCLSTIKHESMYYPGRIRLLAEQMQASVERQPADVHTPLQALHTMSETVAYYKQVYTLLSEQAREQSGAIAFRRGKVAVGPVVQEADNYFRRRARLLGADAELRTDVADALVVRADTDLLSYLLECLIDATLQALVQQSPSAPACCTLVAQADGRFVRFALTNPAVALTSEQLHDLFSPRPDGIPYLLCKQIIREHDTFLGHPGCRINAEPATGGGHTVWFTLPAWPQNP
ncbi:MAG: DUF5112 domain-containing protein [Bacteroidaceae bacterium]|nr:DUF5112 domain-containing protein [Bacteroidaceae bacterium]